MSPRACTQASQFVQRFHSERKTKLNLLLESERWRQADVPAEFQTIADHVTSTGGRTDADGGPSEPQGQLRVPWRQLHVAERKGRQLGSNQRAGSGRPG